MTDRSSVGTFRYLSVCSGIEAATVAWHELGWKAAAYSEIDKFPRAVLQHHYPEVPLHGDFTTIKGDEYGPIDLLCGGTPCQAFSFAGNRKGLDDERGNLALEFCLLAERCGARWIVWENVPGVLSSNEGRDFAAFLGALSELGYGWSYRVLDLQFFGIPQRRRRVVLVGYLGDWRTAAAVLFEPESLQGHPAPRREAGQTASALTANGVGTCGADDNQGQGNHLVAHTLRGEGFDASEDGTGRGTPIVAETISTIDASQGSKLGSDQWVKAGHAIPVAFGANDTRGTIETTAALNCGKGGTRMDFESETFIADPVAFNCKQTDACPSELSPTLRAMNSKDSHQNGGRQVAVAVSMRGREDGAQIEVGDEQSFALRASQGGSDKAHMFDGYAVRRLTPTECERLMGFPDSYTRIPYRGKPADQCPDGPRYKALGNSWGVPVFEWVGRRIDMMEKILKEQAE